MNRTLIAVVVVVILTFGVYIGLSGFMTQYAVETSRGSAAQVICAPDAATASVGQSVRFSLSGITGGAAYHWASDEGTSQTLPDGRFAVTYTTRGVKTAWAFILSGEYWQPVRCSVTVQ
jgi:hypothetical protein